MHFWYVWSLVYVVFKAMQIEKPVKDLASEVHVPVKKLQVSEEMQTEIEKDNSQLVEQPVKVTQKDNEVTKERTKKLKKQLEELLNIAKDKMKVKLSAPSLQRYSFKAAAVRGYAKSLDSSDLDSQEEFGLDQDEDDSPDHHVFPVIGQLPIDGVAQPPLKVSM